MIVCRSYYARCAQASSIEIWRSVCVFRTWVIIKVMRGRHPRWATQCMRGQAPPNARHAVPGSSAPFVAAITARETLVTDPNLGIWKVTSKLTSCTVNNFQRLIKWSFLANNYAVSVSFNEGQIRNQLRQNWIHRRHIHLRGSNALNRTFSKVDMVPLTEFQRYARHSIPVTNNAPKFHFTFAQVDVS